MPEIYQQFERDFLDVKEALGALGATVDEARSLGEKERRLVRLEIAVDAESEGAVSSHVREHVGTGVSEEEILHTLGLAPTL